MPSVANTALEALSRAERPVRFGLEVVLVIALALLLARVVWLIAFPVGVVATYTDRPLPVPMQGAGAGLAINADRTALILTNPFDQGAAEIEVQDAPETALNLELLGLRMSTEGGESGNAIIRTPDGAGRNYSVGEEILAGVTLERILSDRVIINRDGANETLMRAGRGEGLSVITDGSQIEPASNRTVTEPETVEPEVAEARIAAPEMFFGNINASPVVINGVTTGYRLSPIGDGALMAQAGLEPGDILLRINGASVERLDMTDVIDRMASADSVELTVNRDGSERMVRLTFGE